MRKDNAYMTASRRAFINSVATTGAALPFACPSILSAKSSNESLNIASIAVGGRGWSDVNGAAHGHNLVAFCDVMTEADLPREWVHFLSGDWFVLSRREAGLWCGWFVAQGTV